MEHKITIYSTSTCPSCKMLKAYLQEKGFGYENKDVGEDAKAREEMIAKNGGLLSTPTVEIDGKIIVGFDKEKVDVLLGVK
ncbi:MAG: hypothetical protein HYY55_00540 [Candidatus Niyogibacteria bacterium]|nr:MAG: hypothetical protein HYY55_00540 [Candidatus Niyogibacteria bacterium]